MSLRRLESLVSRYPFHAYGIALTAICVAASVVYSCAH